MMLSIAIPCYEMNGRGSEMLQYSLDVLKNQETADFEVVISDHSVDNDVYDLCQRESKKLNIKYLRNVNKRGSSSANVNNAIINCSGRLIKILCQDDFLYRADAITKTVGNFNYHKKWLVSSYFHTQDRIKTDGYHVPKLSNRIYLENLIGTHSCLTILNEEPILFDENLIWFMDCEYYYRLYQKYGSPEILLDPTLVQFLWPGQVTNTLIDNDLVIKEQDYIVNKHEGGEKMGILKSFRRAFISIKAKIQNNKKQVDGIEVAEKYYNERKLSALDINEHLDTLRTYASQVEHITELGVRSIVSTWSFILGKPKRLISVDIVSPSNYLKDDGYLLRVVKNVCVEMGIDFTFILGDSLMIDLEETDLLFIDTLHTYSQLIQELNRHGNKSRKWIALHDTESCKDYFINSVGVKEGGLQDAIDEFLSNNDQWFVKEVYTNNNGLTILERKRIAQ